MPPAHLAAARRQLKLALKSAEPGAGRVPATQGFSVLELLVVVGMLCLLASLLFPALLRGKTSAQRIQCVHNLRQLGLALQLYWDENQDLAFRYRGAATNYGDVFWFGWLARGPEGTRDFDPRAGKLHPYLSGRGVELCPALSPALKPFKLKARGEAFGYGYNLNLSASPEQPPVNVNTIRNPANFAVLVDAAQVNTFQAPASPANPMLEEFYYVNSTEATVHFRHQRSGQVLFRDGHVASEKPVPGSLDLRLPQELIGRIGTDKLRRE